MNELKTALKCLATNIQATKPDAVGHIFCYIVPGCRTDCKEKCFCADILGRVEHELNRRKQVAEALTK